MTSSELDTGRAPVVTRGRLRVVVAVVLLVCTTALVAAFTARLRPAVSESTAVIPLSMDVAGGVSQPQVAAVTLQIRHLASDSRAASAAGVARSAITTSVSGNTSDLHWSEHYRGRVEVTVRASSSGAARSAVLRLVSTAAARARQAHYDALSDSTVVKVSQPIAGATERLSAASPGLAAGRGALLGVAMAGALAALVNRRRWTSRVERSGPLVFVLAGAGGVALGLGSALLGARGALLGVVLGALAVLPSGAWALAALALVLTALCRPLTAGQLAPDSLNFVDLPLVALSLLVAAWGLVRHRRAGWSSAHVSSIAVLVMCTAGVVAVASFLYSGVEALRFAADVAIFGEPWALLVALLISAPPAWAQKAVPAGLIVIALAHSLAAVPQVLDHGPGDQVVGLFRGSFNGAHLAAGQSSVALLLGLAWALECLARRRYVGVVRWLSIPAITALTVVLADAKQIILVLPLGLLAILVGVPRRVLAPLTVLCAFSGAAVLGLLVVANPQWTTGITVLQRAVDGNSGKAVGLRIITRTMDEDPASWVLGIGPGTTVSRVALLSGSDLQRPGSAVGSLPLSEQPVTKEVVARTLQLTETESSFQSGWSSAWGLFGDFGLAGALTYVLALLVALWATWGPWSPVVAAGRAGVVMLSALAFVDNWLEQAYVTLPVFTVLALGIWQQRARERTAQVPGRLERPAELSYST